jgi:hypothetical protein
MRPWPPGGTWESSECFVSRWAVPKRCRNGHLEHAIKFHFGLVGWNLRYQVHLCSHFLLMPAEFDGCCMYQLHSLRFFAVRDHCPTATILSVSVLLIFGRSIVLFAYAYALHWCSLCPSALDHSCHMASPFPLENCEPLPRCPPCWFSAFLQHCSVCLSVCCSIQLAVFSVPSSTDKFGVSFFLSLWATMFGRCIIVPGIRRNQRGLFISSFWNLLK